MRPRFLVYILSAIIIAFVIKGYFCAETLQRSLHAIENGENTIDEINGLYVYVEAFKSHLIFSGVLALVIAICCRLKAPQ